MPTALDNKSAVTNDDDDGGGDANDTTTAPPADDNVEEKKDEGASTTTDDVSPNEKEAAVEKEKGADDGNDDDDKKEPAAKKVASSNDKKEDDEPQDTCSCRKSGCDLLYCPCFGDGRKCSDACKCKNCKNPKGVNPKSVYTGKEKEKKEKEQAEEAKKFQQLLMLTVSPGRLGLTLSIDGEVGALITNIDPACTFRGQVGVGDRIMTVDGEKVYTLEDAKRGKDRVRRFGILKAATVTLASQATQLSPLKHAPKQQERGGPSSSPPFIGSRADPRKQTFPYLTQLHAIGTDRDSEHRRENLMAELLQWDKRNKVNTTCKMGPSKYQVVCVPLRRRESVNKRELDNQTFHQYNKQTKVFDKFLDAWASYCDGTREDASNMILYHLAKKFPQCYVKNFEMATKKVQKIEGPPPAQLPPDFVSYDGTNDIRWNTRYGELKKYYEENGNSKVYSKSPLGAWVCSQRSAKNQGAKSLTPKRIELLDALGMLWSGIPEGWTKPPKGGCPRQNRAIAAKLVYPDLTIREALLLAGFEDEELDRVKDPKHTWRTGYVYYKDQILKKVDKYPTARKAGARVSVEKLVDILQGEEENRFEQVFGEYSNLLSGFLEAAEERRRNGIVEQPRRRIGKNKRKINDGDEDAMTGDDEEPARKQPHIEEEVGTYAHQGDYTYEQDQWRQRGRDDGYFGV